MLKEHKHSCSKCNPYFDDFKLSSGQTILLTSCYSKGLLSTLLRNKLFNQSSMSYAQSDFTEDLIKEMVVATIDDIPVAYIYKNIDDEIHRFTRADLRGQGISRRLIEAMFPKARVVKKLPSHKKLFFDETRNLIRLY